MPTDSDIADAVVWVADGVVTDGLDYGDTLVRRLTDRGLRVIRRDLTSGDTDIPAARLHVLSGGATSVHDQSGWMTHGIPRTRSLIDSAQRDDHLVVGVCLGAQMVAETLWPGAVHAADRIEVGLTEVWWGDGQDGASLVVPTFHYEQIRELAVADGGGEVLATGADCPVQGFRFGAGVWGVQFHPELAPDDLRLLVGHHRGTIEERGATTSHVLGSVDALESHWTSGQFDWIFDQILEPRYSD